MAVTPTIRASGASAIAAAAGGTLRSSQASVVVAANFPTEEVRASTAQAMVAANHSPEMRASQAAVIVAARGRSANPTVRLWTFTLDNHDYLVLRLGDDETLVYDFYSEQWMTWDSGELGFWRANTGTNWLGGIRWADEYGSSILVGDDTFGRLMFLDPEQGFDQHPDEERADEPFTRILMAQLAMRGRSVAPCDVIYLTADNSGPSYAGASVLLEISDDAGKTFQAQDAISIVAGDYTQEFAWRSLGQIAAPGRLFRITDNGFARVDSLEMNEDAG